MDFDAYREYLKKNKRKPVQTLGLPGLQNGMQYNFDIYQDSDNTYCIRIHDWYFEGRDQTPAEPKYPEQLTFISEFGTSFKAADVIMFTSLSGFENFLKAILPLAVNKL